MRTPTNMFEQRNAELAMMAPNGSDFRADSVVVAKLLDSVSKSPAEARAVARFWDYLSLTLETESQTECVAAPENSR